MNFIPTKEEINEFMDQSVDFWMEKIKSREIPAYADLKAMLGEEVMEEFERHMLYDGICAGIGMVTGFLKDIHSRNGTTNETITK
jgi:hypothetical protein